MKYLLLGILAGCAFMAVVCLSGCATEANRERYAEHQAGLQGALDARKAIEQVHAMQAAQPIATFTHYEFQR
jgi:hypothetical protein